MTKKVGIYLIAAVAILSSVFANDVNVVKASSVTVPANFHGSAFSGCTQVISITSSSMHTTKAAVNVYQKSGNRWHIVFSDLDAVIGENGMVYDKVRKQGTNTTPSGVYTIPFAFGQANNPGTKMTYKKTDANSYWDENSGNRTYNRWLEYKPSGSNYEQLATQPLYKYALVVGFNWNQIPNKGAGIFIHLKPKYYTGGCVGIDESTLVNLLKWLNPSNNPRVLICPQYDFSKYYYSDNLPANQSCIDYPTNSTYNSNIPVIGWAVLSAGLKRVDIYADKKGVGSVSKFTSRPDVQKIINASGDYVNENNGYNFSILKGTLKRGTHELEVAAISKDGSVSWQTKTFKVG